MSELRKPYTPAPWEVGVTDNYTVYVVNPEDGPVARILGYIPDDADAIADLWGWIRRAERYEEALRRVAEGWAGSLAEYVAEFAADVLREEGRL